MEILGGLRSNSLTLDRKRQGFKNITIKAQMHTHDVGYPKDNNSLPLFLSLTLLLSRIKSSDKA